MSPVNAQSLEELKWWLENIQLGNGKYFFQSLKKVLLQKNAFQKGCRASCKHHDVNERGAEISHKCVKAFSSEVSSAFNHQGRNTSLPDTQQDRVV